MKKGRTCSMLMQVRLLFLLFETFYMHKNIFLHAARFRQFFHCRCCMIKKRGRKSGYLSGISFFRELPDGGTAAVSHSQVGGTVHKTITPVAAHISWRHYFRDWRSYHFHSRFRPDRCDGKAGTGGTYLHGRFRAETAET